MQREVLLEKAMAKRWGGVLLKKMGLIKPVLTRRLRCDRVAPLLKRGVLKVGRGSWSVLARDVKFTTGV